MVTEIERKFIVAPNNPFLISLISSRPYTLENRYYLYRGKGVELRFTSLTPVKGKAYFYFDRMQVLNNSLSNRSKERLEITKGEFDTLLSIIKSKFSKVKPIIRKSYLISQRPKLEIKVYEGDFEGLVRAEVEFSSTNKLRVYKPLDWFGKELTNTKLGNDVKLPDLSNKEFSDLLKKFLSA